MNREPTNTGDNVAKQRQVGNHNERRKAMEAFVGIRKAVAGAPDGVEVVRSLRRGERLERLGE
jgi:hypothetical protein